MRRWVVAAAISLAARSAAADQVGVTVVDVAGGMAYLDKGSSDGVVRGTRVTIAGRALVVVEVTAKSAVVALGQHLLAIGARGTAVVTPATLEVKPAAKPRPLAAFQGQWPAPVTPASTQSPAHVALGARRDRGNASLTVVGHGFAAAERGRTDGSAEARVIASLGLMSDRPLAADLDIAGRAYRTGANRLERVPLFVRAAQLRYGDAADPRFAVGRLRHASSWVGMLDGARASVRLGRLELAAFGGVLPDPISGKFVTGATRFGGDAILVDDSARWHPRVAITAYGSTWDGKLDERRLAVSASADRAEVRLDAWAELQSFSSNNPWGATSVELTGAGATAGWRDRGKHLAVDITFLRPERSLRLAAALPPAWLCTQQPQSGDVLDEACGSSDSWVSGNLTTGLRGAWWSIDAIAAIGRSDGVSVAYDSTGFLIGEVRLGPQRAFASIAAGSTSSARWTAGQVGAGLALAQRFDIALSYRPELLDPVAATEALVLHSGVVDLHYTLTHDLDLALSAAGTTGADRDVLTLLSTIVWRPWP